VKGSDGRGIVMRKNRRTVRVRKQFFYRIILKGPYPQWASRVGARYLILPQVIRAALHARRCLEIALAAAGQLRAPTDLLKKRQRQLYCGHGFWTQRWPEGGVGQMKFKRPLALGIP
jgi:hypothetical protein